MVTEDGQEGLAHGLEAVIVVPTRELAYQIAHEGRKIMAGTGIKIVAMKKGMRIECEAQTAPDQAAEREQCSFG